MDIHLLHMRIYLWWYMRGINGICIWSTLDERHWQYYCSMGYVRDTGDISVVRYMRDTGDNLWDGFLAISWVVLGANIAGKKPAFDEKRVDSSLDKLGVVDFVLPRKEHVVSPAKWNTCFQHRQELQGVVVVVPTRYSFGRQLLLRLFLFASSLYSSEVVCFVQYVANKGCHVRCHSVDA